MLKLRMFAAAMLFAGIFGGATLTLATPQTASAAGCTNKVLLFPTWYRGLGKSEGGGCSIKSPADVDGGLQTFIFIIALNVIEMVLVAGGYIAAGYIIWGGFQYMLVAANPERVTMARKTIQNAVIGLIISFSSIAIINIVTSRITGGTGNDFGMIEIEAGNLIPAILGAVYWVAGVAAVVTLIAGGIGYMISDGNPQKITKSKDIILYSVVGLVVILVAFTITNFVIGRF